MIPANQLQKGTVLSDKLLPTPWQHWVVLDINHDAVLLKRPYTNQGKSFIVFEEASIPLATILTTTRFTITRI